MTEKVIKERIAGRDLFAESSEELRNVTARFLRALIHEDFDLFLSVQPTALRRNLDREDFAEELLKHPDIPDLIRAMEAAAGREVFEIDRVNYQAALTLEAHYKFLYVLEVDGWKISGPLRVGT